MTGIIIFGHGSRIESANESVRSVAAELARDGAYDFVEAAFLELGHPDLAEAASGLISRGATRIVVLPYFLTLGTHLQRDLPRIVQGISNIHRDVSIEIAPPLEGHPVLVQILRERAAAAFEERVST